MAAALYSWAVCHFESLVARLSSAPMIERQILLQLACSYINYPFERYFDRHFGGLDSSHDNEHAAKPKSFWVSIWTRPERPPGTGGHRDALKREPLWHWSGLPIMNSVVRFYHIFSTITLAILWTKTIFWHQVTALAHWLTGWPGHCIVLGRVVFHPKLNALTAMTVSCYHLVWRGGHQLQTRGHLMSPMAFVHQSQQDLERFFRRIEVNANCCYLRGDEYSVDIERVEAVEQAAALEIALRVDQLGDHEDRDRVVDMHERVLRHILCFQVRLGARKTLYKLRPHRTKKARALVARKLILTTITSIAGFIGFGLPVTIAVVILCLSDLRYVQTFPGCHEQLDREYAAGQITSIWTCTLTRHRIAALIFDLCENLPIWIDSSISLTVVISLMYVLTDDVLMYWRHLHRRLERDLARLRRLQLETRAQLRPLGQAHWQGQMRTSSLMSRKWRHLNYELCELQWEIYDFFSQVNESGKFVSDVLTMSSIVWLTLCLLFSTVYLSGAHNELPIVAHMVLMAAFFTSTHLAAQVVKLHSCCLRSYPYVCSLMALCPEIETKRQFIKVLEFFNERQLTSYKLFRRYPYTNTTYMAVFGWTISCIAICYALFGRHVEHSRNAPGASNNYWPKQREIRIIGTPDYSVF